MCEQKQFDDITKLIPQRPPMLMVQRMLSCDDTKVTTELDIVGDNIFVEDGCLAEPGIIENMAQTAAVMQGWKYREQANAADIRYLCEIRNLTIEKLPSVGETLKTIVEVKASAAGVIMVSCHSETASGVVANGSLKIQGN